MVTHDVEEAFYLADRICLMDKGKIIQAGTPHELLFKPANDFVKSFLKEQRLQLEFKTVRLADVWDLLPKGDQHIQNNAVNADTPLWTGLESLKYHAGEKLSISNNGEIRSAGFRDLMSAFYQYQTARHG
jgi:osmoprotectant transport system ATP-binding protein